MSTELPTDVSEDSEKTERDVRSPISSTLATLGKKMRVYGNTMLVLMIVMFLISIFLFTIVFQPVRAALIIIYSLKVFEFIFYIDFLNSLKLSENIYGGQLLFKSFVIFLSMLILSFILIVIGTISVSLNYGILDSIYSSAGVQVEKVFFYYTMMSEGSAWMKFIELSIPILNIIGSILLFKWGTLYIGDRMDDEVDAPFPKEMRLMVIANGIVLSGIILGLVGIISDKFLIFTLIGVIGNLLQVIGSITTSVGFSRAGFYLELYTTEDKKKFFSSKIYEE